MIPTSSRSDPAFDIIFFSLFFLGLAVALFGILLDALPGTSPGINLPQLLTIGSGVLLIVAAYMLRNKEVRRRRLIAWRKQSLSAVFVSLLTLAALELAVDNPKHVHLFSLRNTGQVLQRQFLACLR